jgi:hypothetical protein
MQRSKIGRLLNDRPGHSSDCHGFQNPCGSRVGYRRVRVRVGICQPSINPYPQHGFRVTRTVTRHFGLLWPQHIWPFSNVQMSPTTLENECLHSFLKVNLFLINVGVTATHHLSTTTQKMPVLNLSEFWAILQDEDMY